ncbi:hypothetical protein PO909_008106 [Leuciscus waleckii]
MMTDNDSCAIDDAFKYVLYSSAFSIVFILGLLFNTMAMYIFACRLKMRNETTTYMMNLVASDTLFVFSLPFRTFYFINREWPFGKALCQISVALFYTNMYGSILFLTCISVDRFLAIVHPFASKTLRTKRNARIACCVIWVLLLSGGLTAGFVMDTTSSTSNVKFAYLQTESKNQWKMKLHEFTLSLVQIAYLLPALLLLFSYCSILRVLRRLPHRRKIRHRRTLTVIYWVLVVFFLCFTPYHLNLLGYTLTQVGLVHSCGLAQVTKALHPVVLSLASTNCCLNPLIYYFSSSLVHKEPTGSRGSASQ